jgi:putative transport protein
VVDFLADDALLLAFVVIAIGAAAGAVRLWGVALGPAAALFAGLAFGAWDKRLTEAGSLAAYQTLGLVLFTYTVGLASGPTFVAGLRRGGARAAALTVALVVVLALACWGVSELMGFGPAERAGLFAGSTTNTPALQAAIEALGPGQGNPVVAYSLAYPFAVASMIVVLVTLLSPVGRRITPPSTAPERPALVNWTVRIQREARLPLGDLRGSGPDRLSFSRVQRHGRTDVATDDVVLVPDDLVVVVGTEPAVRQFVDRYGERSDRHLPLDRYDVDFRRMVVSNHKLAGQKLGDLDLPGRLGVVVSRVRRGDTDLIAHDDLALQLGDRVRVVGSPERLPAAAKLFGDSERHLGEVDALGFALGVVVGILVGSVVLPLGDVRLELGAAGGALVVGLALSVVGRTGPITWQIPHGANLTLRQLGILMFLACVGIRSGDDFAAALGTTQGTKLLVAGSLVSFLFAALIAIATSALLRRDAVESSGMLSGIDTQPAALAFATARTGGSERVAAAYALTFPMAMVAKIIVVQFLV